MKFDLIKSRRYLKKNQIIKKNHYQQMYKFIF